MLQEQRCCASMLIVVDNDESHLRTVCAGSDTNELTECDESFARFFPDRQREAFILRYWEELDVSETAKVMGCSEGSVKTHCSRATHALAKVLRSKGITL